MEGTLIEPQTVEYGGKITTPAPPTRKSYIFAGWYRDTVYNTLWNFATDTVNNDVTLYAKWVVMDIDGNIYKTVKIGNQVWMVENFKATRFNDGTSISNVVDSGVWAGLTTPGYCWYNNDFNNIATYGALYNWYTINTGKLAPAGWRVPDTTDWNTLQNYLIDNGYNWDGTTIGNKIGKSLAAKTNWQLSTTLGNVGNDLETNNKSGFSAMPGGFRYSNSIFNNIGNFGFWWSTTEFFESSAHYYYLNNYSGSLTKYNIEKNCGYSIRLLRDYY